MLCNGHRVISSAKITFLFINRHQKVCRPSIANSTFGKYIDLFNTNWPTTFNSFSGSRWRIAKLYRCYSAMRTSIRIEYKFFVDKGISVQGDASGNAFDTCTGGVQFESRPPIKCPIIFLDFPRCLQENSGIVSYMRPHCLSSIP